jgi:hypothetical protein
MHLKSFQQFVLESDASSEYDELLDLYNSVGLDKMTRDEIASLKSGGTTARPNRFKVRDLAQSHRARSQGWVRTDGSIDEKSVTQIRELRRILDENPEWEIWYPFDTDPPLGHGLDTFFEIVFKNAGLFDALVEVWYGSRENYERTKGDSLLEMVRLRGGRDFKKPDNGPAREEMSDRMQSLVPDFEFNEPPGREYPLATLVPKSWFDRLFKGLV